MSTTNNGPKGRRIRGSRKPTKAQILKEAKRNIKGMVREGNGLKVWAELREINSEIWIVFTGGRRGEHKILASVSDAERVKAHWEGYSIQAEVKTTSG